MALRRDYDPSEEKTPSQEHFVQTRVHCTQFAECAVQCGECTMFRSRRPQCRVQCAECVECNVTSTACTVCACDPLGPCMQRQPQPPPKSSPHQVRILGPSFGPCWRCAMCTGGVNTAHCQAGTAVVHAWRALAFASLCWLSATGAHRPLWLWGLAAFEPIPQTCPFELEDLDPIACNVLVDLKPFSEFSVHGPLSRLPQDV